MQASSLYKMSVAQGFEEVLALFKQASILFFKIWACMSTKPYGLLYKQSIYLDSFQFSTGKFLSYPAIEHKIKIQMDDESNVNQQLPYLNKLATNLPAGLLIII